MLYDNNTTLLNYIRVYLYFPIDLAIMWYYTLIQNYLIELKLYMYDFRNNKELISISETSIVFLNERKKHRLIAYKLPIRMYLIKQARPGFKQLNLKKC